MDPEDMDYLLKRVEGRIRRAFREMVREIKDENPVHGIASKISTGNVDQLLAGVDDAASKLAIDINTGFVQAGQKMSRWLDSELDARVTFDVASDEAIAWMTDQAETLIQAMVAEQQEVARYVTSVARARGLNDADVAQEVFDSIGLNVQQVDYVESYRDALESQDYKNALDREMADGRYDGVLTRADEAGIEIAPDRIDAMVDAYRDNWVDERGDTIALQEGQSAMNAGLDEGLDQAIGLGDLVASDVTQTWFTRFDAKVRASHRSMHGQTVPVGEPFESGDGTELRYPGDEDAPADETMGCRCVRQINLAA